MALSASTLTCAPSRPKGPPDILLITIDTLRADSLSSYGYKRGTSPFIDSLAREGVRFDQAYATSSWTTPSVVSMLTSTNQSRHGMGARMLGTPRAWSSIPATLPNLAELLQRQGYRTFGLAANTNLAPERGFARGFERYECLGTADLDEVEPALDPFLAALAATDGPWFFWLHLLDPHAPYVARRPWIDGFDPEHDGHRELDGLASEVWAARAAALHAKQRAAVRALYDSEIRDTDEFLRRLFERLPGARDTFVLLTSDHGEEFLEHGGTLHGRTLFEESIRIPLIVRLPDRRFAGSVVEGVVSLIDVLPTLAGAAGAVSPADAEGANLILPDGPSAPAGRVVFAELLRGVPERASIDGRWKLITRGMTERIELYDLQRDAVERFDVAGRPLHAERIRQHLAIQAAFAETQRPPEAPTGETPIAPEQLEALRALGYVGATE